MTSPYLKQPTFSEAERAQQHSARRYRAMLTQLWNARQDGSLEAERIVWTLEQPECAEIFAKITRDDEERLTLGLTLKGLREDEGTLDMSAALAANGPGMNAERDANIYRDWRDAVRWALRQLDPMTEFPRQTLSQIADR